MFADIEAAGYNVEDILFWDASMNWSEYTNPDSIPDDVLAEINTYTIDNCLLIVNRGRGAGDGMLEDPGPGYFHMYDRNKLTPFVDKGLRQFGNKPKDLEETGTYYARDNQQRLDAIIGIVWIERSD